MDNIYFSNGYYTIFYLFTIAYKFIYYPCYTIIKNFSVSIGIVAPFYSASLVETVQSEIASEKPGILDVFRDGAIRLLEVGTKGRIIPIYALLAPHVAYGVAKYLFSLIVRSVASRIMCLRDRHSQERTVSLFFILQFVDYYL